MTSPTKAVYLAGTKFLETASRNLPKEDLDVWEVESQSRGFVRQGSPSDTWNRYVHLTLGPKLYREVTFGLSRVGEEKETIIAKALVFCLKGHEYIQFVWSPRV